LWVLWIIALLIVGGPTFAATQEDAYVPDPHNAFEVSYSNVEDAVTQALTEKGVGDKVAATINGRKSKPIFAYNKPVTIETRGLQYDKMSGHWEGSIVFVADGDVISAIPASGHFDEMVEVAVLKREMRPSDIIHENDVEIRDFSVRNTRTNTVTDISSLIGKAPLRTISPYRPIRSEEIVNPSIMKKDAMVQMHYSLPGMDITTAGQAMTAGAKGDVINVRNVTSKRMVRAVIEDSETVSVATPTQQTSQLTGGDYAAH
jgi:flagella basal body P-ring formation protein FlgA